MTTILDYRGVIEAFPTYGASVTGLVIVASATDVFTITGSATKTIRVKTVTIAGVATAAAVIDVILAKRSTADTAGTSTNPTRVPYDSGDAAATATINAYTANPTTGTLVGNVAARKMALQVAGGSSVDRLVFSFGSQAGRPLILRGTGEVLAVNLNGVQSAGEALDIDIEWTEET